MKKLIMLASLFIAIVTNAQKTRETIFEKDYGNVKAKQVNVSEGDTEYRYLAIIYRNKKYEYVKDYQCIIYLREDCQSLIDAFKVALSYPHEKKYVEWKLKDYSLVYYDFSDDLFIESEKKYTTITTQEISELLSDLQKLKWK